MRLIFALLFSTVVIAGDVHKVVLKFDAPVDIPSVLSQYQVQAWSQLNDSAVYKVSIETTLSRKDLVDELKNNPNIANAEENQMAQLVTKEAAASIDQRPMVVLEQRPMVVLEEGLRTVSGDPNHFTKLTRADLCWSYTAGSGITVAVLDTGVDVSHSFLADSISNYGYDFIDNDYDASEERAGVDSNGNGLVDEGWGHGTHVAGIVKQMAPGVKIMPIRVVDSDGQGDLFSILQGIQYAILAGADVINLSMSITEPSDLLIEWIDLAKFAGVFVVTSAGNENSNQLYFPANERNVLTVTSLDSNFQKSAFANFGENVSLSAPGEDIISCLPGGEFIARSGTSMATPVVTGSLALLLQLSPNISISNAHGRLKKNAFNVDSLNPDFVGLLGDGMIDIWNAITIHNQGY